MKYVQIGILAALVVVAGLLFMVYRQQSQSPAVQPQAAAPVAAPQAAPAQPAEPAPVATAAAPAPQRPSPTRWRKKSELAPASKQPEGEVARTLPPPAPSQPPASPAAETVPAPAPVSTPPAPAPAPAPASNPLTPPSGTEAEPRQPHRVTIPAGTLLAVRLTDRLSTDTNQAGDSFSATLDQPLVVDGYVLAERGARVEGRVLEAEKAGRVRGVSSLAIHLVRLRTSDGQDVAIQTAKFVKVGETSRGEDAAKVGAGAAIGAAIGAIAGGGRGAGVGAAVGGGAGAVTVAATRGKPTVLPSETRLSFKLQEPVTLTEKLR